MTYSYIKSVFPNFEKSKVYDEKSYNNVLINNKNNDKNKNSFLSQFDLPINEKNDNKIKENTIENKNIFSLNEREMSSLLEKNYLNFENGISHVDLKLENRESFENNKSNNNIIDDCSSSLNHVLECVKCKDIISKQLNLEYEKIKNEEIIEVISYITFGIFVLLVLDNISKK